MTLLSTSTSTSIPSGNPIFSQTILYCTIWLCQIKRRSLVFSVAWDFFQTNVGAELLGCYRIGPDHYRWCGIVNVLLVRLSYFGSSIFGISSSTEIKMNQAVQCASVLHANLVPWSFNNWNFNVVIRFGNIVPQKYGSTLLSELRMNFVDHKISPQETYVYYDTMYSLWVTTR